MAMISFLNSSIPHDCASNRLEGHLTILGINSKGLEKTYLSTRKVVRFACSCGKTKRSSTFVSLKSKPILQWLFTETRPVQRSSIYTFPKKILFIIVKMVLSWLYRSQYDHGWSFWSNSPSINLKMLMAIWLPCYATGGGAVEIRDAASGKQQ